MKVINKKWLMMMMMVIDDGGDGDAVMRRDEKIYEGEEERSLWGQEEARLFAKCNTSLSVLNHPAFARKHKDKIQN